MYCQAAMVSVQYEFHNRSKTREARECFFLFSSVELASDPNEADNDPGCVSNWRFVGEAPVIAARRVVDQFNNVKEPGPFKDFLVVATIALYEIFRRNLLIPEADQLVGVLQAHEILERAVVIDKAPVNIFYENGDILHHVECFETDVTAEPFAETRASSFGVKGWAKWRGAPPRASGVVAEVDRWNSALQARRMRSGFTAGPCSLLDRRKLDSANFQELPPSLQDSQKLDHHTVLTRPETGERTQTQVEAAEGV